MRRNDLEITDRAVIDAIMKKATYCQLAMVDGDTPYVVPMCFGYDGSSLYFHSAPAGKKLEVLAKNNKVCFEMDIVTGVVESTKPCDWDIKYESVIGFGKAVFLEGLEEKKQALDIIMSHYSRGTFEYKPEMVKMLRIIKVEIESVTGKASGG